MPGSKLLAVDLTGEERRDLETLSRRLTTGQ
jgi:hypothetical protein